MKFIDLFAGLGGFHVALSKLGHKCVFASEINGTLVDLYKKNFKMKTVHGDIKLINVKKIPRHDILCAGFPCQPFSKAGSQKGLKDKERGDFLNDIAKILKHHKPKYFILENVPHLRQHDDEKTWKKIYKILHDECKYDVKEEYLSPHEFGIPQIRKRLFIVGQKTELKDFKWPQKNDSLTDIKDILTIDPSDSKKLSSKQLECLEMWQEIIQAIPKKQSLPGFPIWSTEFGANYPYSKKATLEYTSKELKNYKGIYGTSLGNISKQKQRARLPRYATNMRGKFPDWKVSYIRRTRKFYNDNKKILKPYIEKLKKYSFSWQKFEWNCGNSERDIFKYIIQFRASGIRVKKTNFAPALVLTSTQIPIIGWEKRYLTVTEAAKLQSLNSIEMPKDESVAFRALGNAVNAHIIFLIANNLFGKAAKKVRYIKKGVKYKKTA